MKDIKTRVIENQYKVLALIKRGGFGKVYYGWDLLLQKPIAIKEVLPEFLQEPEVINMFQDEAINTAKLNHPNIVQIYNLKKTRNNTFYLIMEYVDGVDLNRLIMKLSEEHIDFPVHLKVFIIGQICQALDYAHNIIDPVTRKPLHIVHRDISPSNIMITSEGIVKLIDFGIAKAKFRKSKETKIGILKGKIPYMSPEQIDSVDDGINVDRRSDLFSLGICFYELLTGRRPFVGKSDFSLMKSVASAKLDVTDLEKLYSKELSNIVIKALKKNLNERYQNAHEMQSDIDAYLFSKKVINPSKELKEMILKIFRKELKPKYIHRIKKSTDSFDLKSLEAAESIQNFEKTKEVKLEGEIPKQKKSSTRATAVIQPKDEEAADGVTKIDIIKQPRWNWKKHRFVLTSAVILFLLLIGFLDFNNRWTFFGRWMNSFVYPLTVNIDSIPRGADIIIDNRHLNQVTPYIFRNFSEGSHVIELRRSGYKSVTTTYVSSRNQKELLIRFDARINFNSLPENAVVYVGKRRLLNRTPCYYDYKVGDTLSVKMELEGFAPLDQFIFYSSSEQSREGGLPIWMLTKENMQGINDFVLKGLFQKEVEIQSYPRGAIVYIDDIKIPNAITNCRLQMAFGEHYISFEKEGFRRIPNKIVVDKNLQKRLYYLIPEKVQPPSVIAETPKPSKLPKMILMPKPSLINFGLAEKNKEIRESIIRVKNEGQTTLKLEIQIKGDTNVFAVNERGTVSTAIAPGKADQFKLSFEPINTGEAKAQLLFKSNDPYLENTEYALKGTGTQKIVQIKKESPPQDRSVSTKERPAIEKTEIKKEFLSKEEADILIRKANEAIQGNDLLKARDLLEQISISDDKAIYAKAQDVLSYIFINTMEYEAARVACESALSIDKRLWSARYNLVLVYVQTRQYAKALQQLDELERVEISSIPLSERRRVKLDRLYLRGSCRYETFKESANENNKRQMALMTVTEFTNFLNELKSNETDFDKKKMDAENKLQEAKNYLNS